MAAQEHPSYDPLMSIDEASKYLQRHPQTLKKMVASRELGCVRDAGKRSHLKFRLSALNAWIKRHEVKAVVFAQK